MFDLRADGLRDPFDLLGLDDDGGHLLEVQASFVEGFLAPGAGHQAPHPGENEVETMSHSESLGITQRAHEAQ